MKLEIVTVNGTEYYQWVYLGDPNTIGDLFSRTQDIGIERAKLYNACQRHSALLAKINPPFQASRS